MSALRRYVNTKARPTEHDLVGPHGPETASGEEGSVQPRGLNTVAGNFVHTATGRRCVHHALPDVGFFPKTRIGENAARVALCAPLNLHHRPFDPRGLPPPTFYSIREADYSRPQTATSRHHSDHPKPSPHLRGDVKGYDHDLPKPAKAKVHINHKNGNRKKVKNDSNILNARTI